MKTFTITRTGLNKDDFCWGIEGELATFPSTVCDRDGCGCDRVMIGLNSSRGSTNVMVRDIALDFDQAVEAYYGHLENGGWIEHYGDKAAMRREADQVIATLVSGAADFPDGTVLRVSYDHDTGAWKFSPVEVK